MYAFIYIHMHAEPCARVGGGVTEVDPSHVYINNPGLLFLLSSQARYFIMRNYSRIRSG